MGETVVIKDVDKATYRSLRAEAVKAGLKVEEAASQAFRVWVQQRAQQRVKDFDRIRRAMEVMDRNRAAVGKVKGWSGVDEIRKWRELRTF